MSPSENSKEEQKECETQEENTQVPDSMQAAIGDGAQKDQVKINKVNEMDIKVSRFDKSSTTSFQTLQHTLSSNRMEEVIPNEEPLIQIR